MSEKAEHTPLVADGPDEFGDFHIRSRDERLAKCVVVQNGFMSPEETRTLANEIILSVNALPDLVKALEDSRAAVEFAIDLHGPDPAGVFLSALNRIDAALSKYRG